MHLLADYQPPQLGIHALYGTRRQMLPAMRLLLDFIAERLASDTYWQH